jgi:AcrR family transcriptional regulator
MMAVPALVDALRVIAPPADASSERILDAALRCFAEGNIRAVTMNQIAEKAGLGVATVYRRFARREHLLQAALLRDARSALDNVDAAVARQSGAAAKFIESFVAIIAELDRRPVFAEAMRKDPEALPMLSVGAAPILELGRSYLGALIRSFQQDGIAVNVDADQVADVCARLVHSIALAPDGPIPTHDPEAVRAFARTYVTRLLMID